MRLNGKTMLLCDCAGSMTLDGAALAGILGAEAPAGIAHALCREQQDRIRRALREGRPVVVGCTQESALFEELRAEAGEDAVLLTANPRERAGWSDEHAKALPKIAALLAEAVVPVPPTPSLKLRSEGVVVVLGRDEGAIEAARRLAGTLAVTVLLHDPAEVVPPTLTETPVFKGRITAASGHFGAFTLEVRDCAPALPWSRRFLAFGPAQAGSELRCDVILDLTGRPPLFRGDRRHDGYLRVDPGNPAAIERALAELATMTGEFEKPRHIDFRAELCAAGRHQQPGCLRCLPLCPTGAIQADGDHVAINPYVCGGCGQCAGVCPTGAATHALPPEATLLRRLHVLLTTYRKAGGGDALLLIHDERHGSALIAALARFGRGLPARVLPFALSEVTRLGLETLVVALALGAGQVRVLTAPGQPELEGLRAQTDLAKALLDGLGLGGERVALLSESDPEALGEALYGTAPAVALAPAAWLPAEERRANIRRALDHLQAQAPAAVETIALPAGAPFGGMAIRAEACTLCLSCVGTCPTQALRDAPDRPTLAFVEEACIQCGLCRAICPEKVVSLIPRYSFAESARRPLVLKTEEPARCLRCGTDFGTASTIEKVIGLLAAKAGPETDLARFDRLRMCDDCRVIAEFEGVDAPLAGPARRIVRTGED